MLKDLIKTRREFFNYTQSHLALRAATTQSKISQWENGVIPDTDNLVKLCIALDITMIDVATELDREE